MPALQVRPFRRADRDQLTELINMHVAAVVPGISVSVNTVVSALERQPDEFITDPWVAERVTLFAEQREHLVAAHLLPYRADDEVGGTYRDIGETDWFVCRPPASFLPDSDEAADLLMNACLAQPARWNVRARHTSGELPGPAVYGLPRTWPHIRALYERAGFRHVGDTEVILNARVADLPTHEPRPGETFDRTLGECGTCFTAYAEGRALGFIEVDTSLSRPERHARGTGLADMGNLHIDPTTYGEGGLEHRLLGRAADWLRLCGVDRLLACERAADGTRTDRLTSAGFRELTRTDRGWEHPS
ncbi:N-acetyltransferase [Streptomyces sp. NBC_00443]|uniref:N-acetyltransferase n=1 Tax=Streptomyces sp. NBC_00443 TaxID=2975743 RepID=UPI002E1B238B